MTKDLCIELKNLKCIICDKRHDVDECHYYDNKLIDLRNKLYNRENIFIRMYSKHYNKKCQCIKLNKQCECTGFLTLSKLDNEDYIRKKYNTGILETIYNINQSITQSLRCTAGIDFEYCIKELLIEIGFKENEHFKIQQNININNIFINNKTEEHHKIDIIMPIPKNNSKLKDYKGYIISCKTSTRERVGQDNYLINYVLITLNNYKTSNKNIRVININENSNNLTKFLIELKDKYL